MINFFICLLISILTGYGLAILFSEKGNDWPIKPFRARIQLVLRKIHWKMPQMFYCTTCTSFWTTLISDCVISIISLFLGYFYFFWPFSGFITAGITWTIIEYLNSKEQNINVFVEKEDQ